MTELAYIWDLVMKGPELCTSLIKMIYPDMPDRLASAIGTGGYVYMAITAWDFGCKKG